MDHWYPINKYLDRAKDIKMNKLFSLRSVSFVLIVLYCFLVVATSSSSSSSSSPISNSLQKHVGKLVGCIKNQVGCMVQKTSSLEVPSVSGILKPRSALPGYMRGAGVPVYMVTTSWGSPYVVNEKPNDLVRSKADLDTTVISANIPPDYFDQDDDTKEAKDEDGDETIFDDEDEGEQQQKPEEEEEDEEGLKQTNIVKKYKGLKTPTLRAQQVSMAPMFVDYRDAQSMLMEMKTSGYDVRITATSMARALRQSSILGNGLPTSQVVNQDTGTLEGGYLRYKIVPSSRELYYASHCDGCERIGFFTSHEEEQQRQVLSNSKTNGMKLIQSKLETATTKKLVPRWTVPFELVGRRSSLLLTQKRDSKKEQPDPADYLKDGKKGIPVFYAQGLALKSPRSNLMSLLLKKSNDNNDINNEIPMFFSYEDLLSAWTTMRSRRTGSNNVVQDIPTTPPKVEVFSYVDVVTSIDREQHQRQVNNFGKWRRNIMGNKSSSTSTSTATSSASGGGVENIVFIPSSKSVQFKEGISRTGNCKARLRPMR